MANSNIPKDWIVTKLGKITNITTGKKDVNEGHEDGKYPFFTCSQKEYRINESSFDTEAILVAGNAYFNVKYYKGKFDAYQRTYVIDGFKDNIGPYLYYVLSKNVASLTTNNQGSAVKYIKLRDLTDFEVLLPPSNERSKIIDVFRMIDSASNNTQAVIDQAQIFKKGLMQELFTRGIPGRHKKFKKTELGEIPNDWETMSVEEITEKEAPICYGIIQVGKYFEDGIPTMAIKNLLNDDTKMVQKTHPDIEKKYVRSRIKEEDLLISVKGTIGRTAVVCKGFVGNISRDIARIRLCKIVSPYFLRNYFESGQGQRLIDKATVGTTRKELSIKTLRKLHVPVPSESEQREIITLLRNIHEYEKTSMAYLDMLNVSKKGLMQVLLTGKVRVKG